MKSKPFYLDLPGNNGKSLIIFGLMVGVVGVAVPYFLIIVPFLIGYGIFQIKRSKSDNYRNFAGAVRYYEAHDIKKSKEVLDAVKEDEKLKMRVKILYALINYEEGNYGAYINIMKELPEKKIKLDLDLQLKLGESLMQVQNHEEALRVYTYLLKFNSKSSFLNDKINECNSFVNKTNDK